MMLLIGPCNLKIVKNEKKKGDLIFFRFLFFALSGLLGWKVLNLTQFVNQRTLELYGALNWSFDHMKIC